MEFFWIATALVLALVSLRWINDQFTSSGYLTIGQEIATYLAACDVHLFINNVTVTPNLILGDLTEATFTGYALQNIAAPAAPVNDPTYGGFSTFLPSNVFTCTAAPGTPQTVYGWYLLDAAGALIAAGNLPTPIVINDAGDAVPVQVTLNYPG